MKKEKIDASIVKEEIQKEHSLSKKKTKNDFSKKELDLFKEIYPMVPNKELAKKFLITENEVRNIAFELKLYKDPAFTQNNLVESKKGNVTKASDGSPSEPNYLLDAITKRMTEEERREIMNYYGEGIPTEQALQTLLMAQMVRIKRGMNLEEDAGGMWRSVGEAIDSANNIVVKLDEIRNGTTQNHLVTIDDMILRSLNMKKD